MRTNRRSRTRRTAEGNWPARIVPGSLCRFPLDGSPLIPVWSHLEPEIIEGLDIELVASAGAVRRVAVDRRGNSHFLALRRQAVGVEVVHADADVIDRAWICEFVQAEKSVSQPQ